MRKLLPLALSIALFGPAHAADPATTRTAAQTPTVVELFTSQGCNSCPPADAKLAELAKRPDVVALSFHITYWDRLGWKDPFATEWGTQRQYGYARALRARSVYTPQMVVDGTQDVVGSRWWDVARALDVSAGTASARIPVTVSRDGGSLQVMVASVAAGGPRPPASTVYLVRYDREHSTQVRAGENRGKTLTHANIVREMRPIGRYDGQTFTQRVNADLVDGNIGYAVLIQADGPGMIIGAGKWEPAEAKGS